MHSSKLNRYLTDNPGPPTVVLGPLVGRGGFGEVYRAHRTSPGGLESTVAVKVLRDAAGRKAAQRLWDEAQMLSRVHHPVVVQALDLIYVDDRLALVTEFVRGLDLAECYEVARPPSPKAVVEIVGRLASALEAAWEQRTLDGTALRIVHRDVKPSNVRVGQHGQIRLLDFGIAIFEGERTARTTTNVIVGSAPYMAPERFSSMVSGPEVDVYGLGCCLYQGLSGERFHRRNNLHLLTVLAHSESDAAEHLAARLALLEGQHPEVVALTRECLAFSRTERPPMGDLVDRCEALLDDLPDLSLREWCASHDWPEPGEAKGPLTGRVIVGGYRPKPRASGPAPSTERPVARAAPEEQIPVRPRVQEPFTTKEPALVSSRRRPPSSVPTLPPEALSEEDTGTPSAPPAFPSIPVGAPYDVHAAQESPLSAPGAPTTTSTVLLKPLLDPEQTVRRPRRSPEAPPRAPDPGPWMAASGCAVGALVACIAAAAALTSGIALWMVLQ